MSDINKAIERLRGIASDIERDTIDKHDIADILAVCDALEKAMRVVDSVRYPIFKEGYFGNGQLLICKCCGECGTYKDPIEHDEFCPLLAIHKLEADKDGTKGKTI